LQPLAGRRLWFAGIGGAARVGYSPGAMGHLVRSYARLHRCRLEPPPARGDAPDELGEL